jgi:hypothetical protein
MKTLILPKRSKAQTPAAIATDIKPPQPKTRAERFAQQRRIHLKLKAKLKAQPKTSPLAIAPRPPAGTSIQPFTRKLATIAPTEAAEPKLTPEAIRALGFAVKCMERTDRTLNQRRLMAFHHLRQDPALSNLNPDDLISEQSTPNSCSTQSRLASLSGEPRVGL